MASIIEVSKIVSQLVALNLRPTPLDIKATAEAYTMMLADIPGETLAQAASTHAMGSSFFPSVAELRAAAQTVKVQAQRTQEMQRSQVAVWYAGEWRTVNYPPGPRIMVGWQPWRPGKMPRVPEAMAQEIERRARQIGDALMTEDQHAKAAALVEDWLKVNA